MKKLQLLFGSLFTLLLITGACSHDESESALENTAKITINSPGNDGIFKEGETISINADAVGEFPLHGWNLKIVNKLKNTTIFEKKGEAHKTDLHVEAQWVVKITEHTDMQLQFSVELNRKGTLETKTVNFHCYN